MATTPAQAYIARPKALPGHRIDTHDRVRTDRIDQFGKLTLRHAGRLHYIGIGRTHAGTRVPVLVQDLDIRIINAATGQHIRQLTLDPTRDFQPRQAPTGRPKNEAQPSTRVPTYSDVLRHHRVEPRGFEPLTPALQRQCSTN